MRTGWEASASTGTSWTPRAMGHASSALFKPTRETLWQTSRADFGLRRRNVVIQATQLDSRFVKIVGDVTGLWIAIPRLADAPNVDEVFATGFDLDLGISSTPYNAVTNKCHRHMGVPEEAYARILVGEAGGGVEFVELGTPALRTIESCMNDGKICDEPQIF